MYPLQNCLRTSCRSAKQKREIPWWACCANATNSIYNRATASFQKRPCFHSSFEVVHACDSILGPIFPESRIQHKVWVWGLGLSAQRKRSWPALCTEPHTSCQQHAQVEDVGSQKRHLLPHWVIARSMLDCQVHLLRKQWPEIVASNSGFEGA